MIKDIDLIGIGNGLVDFQYEISEAELNELEIPKGTMQLVSVPEQILLLERLKNHNHHKCSGGSAANTIIAFTRFGGSSAYITLLGSDDLGKFYADEFKELSIDLHCLNIESSLTGTCVVLITPDSERTMYTCLGGVSEIEKECISEEIIARSKWLYIEGYKFSVPSSTEAVYRAVELAKKHDTKIAVTFSDVFITELFRSNLEQVVNNADLVFCNEKEALSYTGAPTVDKAFGILGEACPNVVVTKGESGSLIKWDGQTLPVPSYPVRAVDSTGAGDMYAAGFLYGIIHTGDPLKAGHLASYASSRVVSQFGARLADDHAELRDRVFASLDTSPAQA